MKIYGNFLSPPANQVRLTASALGVDHEYLHVDLTKGEQRGADFLAVNPFGKVPALVDGDFRLAESNAISRYLACRDGSDCAFYPNDIRQRATIDKWMDHAGQNVRTQTGKVLFNKVFAPMLGMPVDDKALAEGREQLGVALGVIDAELADRPYLAGDTATIGDIAMIAAMEPFEMVEFDIARFANVKRWRDGLMAQAWYTAVHARYGAEMAG
ncbi:MAG: glutathione S-transferase family protein [Alphaproteobacteria bacterium]|nr:glutathione S-transferase family protein [Alphaproteobacteria bacterium]